MTQREWSNGDQRLEEIYSYNLLPHCSRCLYLHINPQQKAKLPSEVLISIKESKFRPRTGHEGPEGE